jgi:chitin deacetylase
MELMEQRTVALTFDDGPGPSTERLLDVLAKHHAKATFFFLGRNLRGGALHGDAERALTIAARAAREGHLLGNHTMTHAYSLTVDELLDEVVACDALLWKVFEMACLPRTGPIPIRLPFGPFRPNRARIMDALERAGRPHCHWSSDFGDWKTVQTASQIATAMLKHIDDEWETHRTPILLLHDSGPGLDGEPLGAGRETTVDAIDQLCGVIESKAAEYLTISQCETPRLRFSLARRAG